ncbi:MULTISPECIES: hypothetical protein [Cyanophyceae]|uniref:Uncharacterized protein n=1 Tax=Pseudocalidococcus azoricus BACA0444 TaxID=2918990 RepID=A0AAE4JW95_9CYAN|nr:MULTISPECIES: hypothetical protein [Cyanophyceae]AFY61149.1 hypothetical protein Syn6312_2017 [Synechococcus sp. PCC 6312]MDS3861120.1 hypothetical protein [Pseudocalidococcus azoricus BACA0444]
MRPVITSVAVVLALVSIYAWGNFWLRNLGAFSVLVLWYFAVLQPPKQSGF